MLVPADGLTDLGPKITDATDNSLKLLTNKHSGYRVLIPINSQDSALYALESAMARKWPQDTHFMLTTVIEGLTGGGLESKVVHRDTLLAEQNEHRNTVQKWLKNLTNAFKKVFPHTDSEIECGRIAEKICELAWDWEADYIMVGSHDFNLMDRTALGSIASKILMSAPCTVEAVRFHKLKRFFSPDGTSGDTTFIRQLAEQAPKRIVIATDFSQQAETVIQWVEDCCWLDSTEFRLVNVTETSKREPGVSFLAGSKGYVSEQRYQRSIENKLRAIGADLAAKHPRCKLEVFVLQSDSIAGAILELACMWDADLVLLGAKGADSTDEEKLGSSARPIMDTLECSSIALRRSADKQVHFSWYPELQKTENLVSQTLETEAKKS